MQQVPHSSTGKALHGLTAWLIPPARGWRRKPVAFHRQLLTPLIICGGFVAAIGLTSLLSWALPHYSAPLALLELLLALGAIISLAISVRLIRRDLLEPLSHMRNWAARVRGGNLSARIPITRNGEFCALARDVNFLGESLKNLSQNLDEEVRRQTEQIAQKTHSLQVLYDVAASINVSRDLKDLLIRFLHTMRDIVDAKAGTVRIISEDETQMELVASIGLESEVVDRERIVPLQRCLCGRSVMEGEVLYQEDIAKCGQFVGRPMLEGDNLEMIAVPLQYRGRNLGVYNLFVERSSLDAREDVKALFTSIGRHLGMAIEKARLDNEARRLYIMQERTTLAHELHDSLAQTLASLRFQVSMLYDTLKNEGEAAARFEIDQIKNGLDEAYTELRELLAHFRAPIDARGLLPAIEDMVKRFREQTGIHTFLQKEWDSTRLPVNMEMQVLRIVQEALANVRKHAQAQNVRVMLRCDTDGNYRVLIEDDGVGMARPAFSGHPGEHIGLSIMKERARPLNGDLRIESEQGEGTRVLLTFRYPEQRLPPHKESTSTIPLVRVP